MIAWSSMPPKARRGKARPLTHPSIHPSEPDRPYLGHAAVVPAAVDEEEALEEAELRDGEVGRVHRLRVCFIVQSFDGSIGRDEMVIPVVCAPPVSHASSHLLALLSGDAHADLGLLDHGHVVRAVPNRERDGPGAHALLHQPAMPIGVCVCVCVLSSFRQTCPAIIKHRSID